MGVLLNMRHADVTCEDTNYTDVILGAMVQSRGVDDAGRAAQWRAVAPCRREVIIAIRRNERINKLKDFTYTHARNLSNESRFAAGTRPRIRFAATRECNVK